MTQGPIEAIHMPKNTPYGALIGLFSFTCAFGLIWWMWWLAIGSVIAILGCIIFHLFQKETEYTISKEELEKLEARVT